MTVRSERSGAVTTVILDRPHARNAVDGPTARALADAFRAFDAAEAERMGLVNRVVPTGTARAAAEELALVLSGFPQECLRNDRLSVLDQAGLEEPDALGVEYAHGVRSLAADALDGAARFAAGAGRHGDAGRS
jgi:enoyl-CoA hydratase/carnithine racemase